MLHSAERILTTHAGSLPRTPALLAEVGYQEHKSSALLQQELKEAGFTGPGIKVDLQFNTAALPVLTAVFHWPGQ